MARPKGDSLSSMEMVRQTMEELGYDAKPSEIHEKIKEKFNKEIPTTIISNYKSVIKKKLGLNGSGRGKGDMDSIPLQDLKVLRDLVNRLGSKQVRKLVDMFD